MLRSAADLQRYSIAGTDGDIGQLDRMFFDDEHWTVRYLVVDTGKWLPGRQVLIPPAAVDQVDREGRRIRLRLTREKIKHSPDVDSDKPVSRQQETALIAYYGYGSYGGASDLWGSAAYPPGVLVPPPPAAAAFQPPPATRPDEPTAAPDTQEGDPHLRSTKAVAGYHVNATDGTVGHVDDFLIDETWTVRYFVIDTSNWPGGRSVRIPRDWVRQIDWTASMVHVGVTADQVRRAPELDAGATNPDEQ